MLSFPSTLRIFIALEPCDLRAGMNTLHAFVADKLKENPKDKALFVFTNKRRRLIKVLHFDGTGLWLMTKRHASQCAYWFVFENPLSIPSALRKGW